MRNKITLLTPEQSHEVALCASNCGGLFTQNQRFGFVKLPSIKLCKKFIRLVTDDYEDDDLVDIVRLRPNARGVNIGWTISAIIGSNPEEWTYVVKFPLSDVSLIPLWSPNTRSESGEDLGDEVDDGEAAAEN